MLREYLQLSWKEVITVQNNWSVSIESFYLHSHQPICLTLCFACISIGQTVRLSACFSIYPSARFWNLLSIILTKLFYQHHWCLIIHEIDESFANFNQEVRSSHSILLRASQLSYFSLTSGHIWSIWR